MDHESWLSSLRPKVDGTWNLHQQLPRDLDFFVLLSSIASIIGSQGQSNYATGNAFQDELSRYRLNRGEKAISLNLSMVMGTGYSAYNAVAAEHYVESKRVMKLSMTNVIAALEHYCNPEMAIDPAHSQLIMGLELPNDNIDADTGLSGWMEEPMFANLHQVSSTIALDESKKADDISFSKIQESPSLDGALDILTRGLTAKLTRVLSISPDVFDDNLPLHSYGVDSLIAAELRNWFLKVLKVDVTVFEILGGASARVLGETVAKRIRTQSGQNDPRSSPRVSE
jgi:hypothetical protein